MALADAVVVLHRGRMEDHGPPQRVYLRPATPFAARFMGDSNVIPGRVLERTAAGLVVDTALGPIPVTVPGETSRGRGLGADPGDAAGAVPGGRGELTGRVAVCIRPEHLRPDDSAPVALGEGRLVERHFVGTYQRWRVAVGGVELLIFAQPTLPWETGMAVRLSCDPADVILLASDDPADGGLVEEAVVAGLAVQGS